MGWLALGSSGHPSEDAWQLANDWFADAGNRSKVLTWYDDPTMTFDDMVDQIPGLRALIAGGGAGGIDWTDELKSLWEDTTAREAIRTATLAAVDELATNPGAPFATNLPFSGYEPAGGQTPVYLPIDCTIAKKVGAEEVRRDGKSFAVLGSR
jgi:hypothetical protein